MAQVTKIAKEILTVANAWAARSCRETKENGGSCIDEVQTKYWGTPRSEPYCAAFVWVVVDQACKQIGIPNKLPKTAGALDLLQQSKSGGVLPVDGSPGLGSVFYRKTTANASGHVGIIVGIDEGNQDANAPPKLITVEGNNDDRIDRFEYGFDQVMDPRNAWQFIHTEEMPQGTSLVDVAMNVGTGTINIDTTGVGLMAIAGVAALGLIGYGVYKVVT